MCNIFEIPQEKVIDAVDFLHADKETFFWNLIFSHLMDLTRHAQSTLDNFAISLQYLKNEVRDEVDILHAGKQSFP